MSKNEKIYYVNFKDAVERNKKKIPSVYKKLKDASRSLTLIIVWASRYPSRLISLDIFFPFY